jgi:hypothetical protein
MAFDPTESCTTEEVFNLPICRKDAPETLRLHATLRDVTDWMRLNHVPKDPDDPPYVYRDYLAEWVSANDVVAVGRVIRALNARQIPIPELLLPLVSSNPDAQVRASDVTYVATYAEDLVPVLTASLEQMEAADGASLDEARPTWMLVAGILLAAAGVGLLVQIVEANR